MGKDSKTPLPTIREWYICESLYSFRRLKAVLADLTEEEVLAALKLEYGSRRRHTLIGVLTARAEQFHLKKFHANLEENIHGTH